MRLCGIVPMRANRVSIVAAVLRALLLGCLLLPGLPLQAADDLYATINRLRAGGGQCAGMQHMPAMQPQSVLERAARDVAEGRDLKQSLERQGYRASRTRILGIKGEGVGAQAAQILARPQYCKPLQDAEFTHAGFHLDAGQLLLVMAAPFAPSVALSEPAAGRRLIELVNRARATPRRCGDRSFAAAGALRWNAALAEASRVHAEDMARHNYFSHTGRDGSDPVQRVDRVGYRYRATGENIAAGGKMQADDAVAGWVKSPLHCANLMHPGYTEMGSAYAINAGSELGIYWVQVFGLPR